VYPEVAQVIHEHAAPTHIKENGNTSDGRHHRHSLAGISSHNSSATIHSFSHVFVTHSSKRYIGTSTNKEKSAHHESS
jgi:hypothetical protein